MPDKKRISSELLYFSGWALIKGNISPLGVRHVSAPPENPQKPLDHVWEILSEIGAGYYIREGIKELRQVSPPAFPHLLHPHLLTSH